MAQTISVLWDPDPSDEVVTCYAKKIVIRGRKTQEKIKAAQVPSPRTTKKIKV